MRMKLPACGTLGHGKRRRRSHAAAFAPRWVLNKLSKSHLLVRLLGAVLDVSNCGTACR